MNPCHENPSSEEIHEIHSQLSDFNSLDRRDLDAVMKLHLRDAIEEAPVGAPVLKTALRRQGDRQVVFRRGRCPYAEWANIAGMADLY